MDRDDEKTDKKNRRAERISEIKSDGKKIRK